MTNAEAAVATMAVVKQLASKLTGFGFDNSPRDAELVDGKSVTESLSILCYEGIVPGQRVWCLVLNKGHIPVPACHVLDFRIGSNIYE